MGWQAASFALLAAVVAGGIVWYERSRPSSRVIALVAALAALAVAGRLVLAPIPNVVATTDIALITGYALGGAPGFAVGALAAPVSNLWLGQGPWTPWQMAGWGLCGLAGAALATLSGRRMGRLGLALFCAAAGFAYGALLDLSTMVTYGGEQSLDRYLALSARGIPFNVAHASGNFVLALAAGPALVRMISRYRDRLEFTWTLPPAERPNVRPIGGTPGRSALWGIVLALVVALAFAAPAARAGTPADARRYLERQQSADGGFGASPGSRSNAGMTAWSMLGLESAGRNPLDLKRNGHSPVDYLRAHADGMHSATDLERTILALAGAGVSPYAFRGHDLVAALRAERDGNGSFSGQVNITAFAVFALRSVSAPDGELDRSADWLRRAQNRDGGWGFRPDAPSDADSTGAALQALAAAGSPGKAGADGVRYLRRAQLSDGGFPLASGGASNSQSTAWAVQGAVAAGTNPSSIVTNGRDPISYLASQQASDGHYRYSSSTDQTPIWVTAQALLAVNRRAFPLGRVPRASEPGGVPLPGRTASSPDPGGGKKDAEGPGRGGGAGNEGNNREAAERHEAKAPHRDRTAAALTAAEAGESAAEDDTEATRTYGLAGLGALALALGGGFLWYRRRLP
jgi:energy-coupling factor transport system substrate-specific component